jgi:type III secretion apparatus needle protein
MSGVNFDQINKQLGEATSKIESSIKKDMENFDPQTASQADMIKLQMGLQKWTMAVQLQSNVMKTISEGMKSTIQNIR